VDIRTHETDVPKRTVVELAQCPFAGAAAEVAPDRLEHGITDELTEAGDVLGVPTGGMPAAGHWRASRVISCRVSFRQKTMAIILDACFRSISAIWIVVTIEMMVTTSCKIVRV
jgi:hypothetical protein